MNDWSWNRKLIRPEPAISLPWTWPPAYEVEQSDNPSTRARISGTPLFKPNQQQGTVQYGREEASLQIRQMLFDGLTTPNEVARQEARTNAKAYNIFGRSEITALKALEAYQLQFNTGQRTLLALLDSANEMFVAKSVYTNALCGELFTVYRILTSMGGLNQALGVTLSPEPFPLEK